MGRISFEDSELKLFTRSLRKNAANQGATHHNPFGLSFKGRILTSDVFESQKVENSELTSLKEKAIKISKIGASAIAGTVASAKNSFSNAISQIKGYAVSFYGKASNMVDKIVSEYKISQLQKKSIDELSAMLSDALEAKAQTVSSV